MQIDNVTGHTLTICVNDGAITLQDKGQTQSAFALKNTPGAALTLVSKQKFTLLNFIKRTRWSDLQPLGPTEGPNGPVEYWLPFDVPNSQINKGVIKAKKISPTEYEVHLKVKPQGEGNYTRGAYRFTVESQVDDDNGGCRTVRHDPDFDIEC